jgi:predicted DNA-binding transcriptional regulator AlpA
MFQNLGGRLKAFDEHEIYTWKDARERIERRRY